MNYDVIVLGGGESGVGAALLAHKHGLSVFLSEAKALQPAYQKMLDEHGIPYEVAAEQLAILPKAGVCVKSPGIPPKANVVQKIKAAGIPILSEIAFAGRFTKAKITGITGTNGKTTTTLLTYHVYKKAGLDVRCAGNVGRGFAMDLFLHDYDPAHYVLELSSFQLEALDTFRIHTGILTNLTPDHLDRYEYTADLYYEAKFNMLRSQTEEDVFIWCADDEESARMMKNRTFRSRALAFGTGPRPHLAAWTTDNALYLPINTDQTPFEIMITELAIKGKHNVYNSLAAALAARVQDIAKEDIREAFADFQNIEHRLEFVNKIKGIDYINDSKATNVNAVWYALECTEGPIIWIAGGVDKGNDYSSLVPLVKDKVKTLICLGIHNGPLLDAFKEVVPTIMETQSMEEAVKASYYMGKNGDKVLLSPACASFDLFKNYEDRGRQFKHWVNEL
jgi:UDP-N-acetylmuramoylalanine--D-glutamate ligase